MLLDDQMLKNANEYRAGIFYWEGIGVDCVYFTNMRKKVENSSITKLGGGDCANGPVIDANGDIYPCCGSPGDIVICNAFTDSPLDYYEDETAVSLLRALSNPSELPDTCLSCMKNGSPAYQYVHYSFQGLSEYASFKATGFKAFKNHAKTRKVIIFGAGNDGKEALERCVNDGIEVAYVLDNNHFLWRSEINGVPIVGPNVLRRIDLSQFDLLICTRDISDAVKFASELGFKSIFAYALFVEQDERGYSPMRIRYFHFV